MNAKAHKLACYGTMYTSTWVHLSILFLEMRWWEKLTYGLITYAALYLFFDTIYPRIK